MTRRITLTALALALLIGLAQWRLEHPVKAQALPAYPLNPGEFTSLGGSPFASGTYTIDTSMNNAAPSLSGPGITTPIAGVFFSPSGGSVARERDCRIHVRVPQHTGGGNGARCAERQLATDGAAVAVHRHRRRHGRRQRRREGRAAGTGTVVPPAPAAGGVVAAELRLRAAVGWASSTGTLAPPSAPAARAATWSRSAAAVPGAAPAASAAVTAGRSGAREAAGAAVSLRRPLPGAPGR